MNRVAVITDIHANMAALEPTLSELEALSVDAVYCGGDLVGYGHAGIRFVNCGAVGKPKDHDPRAAFAILEAQDGAVSASIRRVCYDAGAVAHEMRAVGLPEELAEKLVAAA